MRIAAMAAGLVAGLALAPGPASAESVLRLARGLPSAPLTVVQDRAVVVEAAVPFTEVSVAQPAIADISPLSDRAIYVVGRSRGITTLTILGEGGRLIANVPVQVTADLGALQGAIDEVLAR